MSRRRWLTMPCLIPPLIMSINLVLYLELSRQARIFPEYGNDMMARDMTANPRSPDVMRKKYSNGDNDWINSRRKISKQMENPKHFLGTQRDEKRNVEQDIITDLLNNSKSSINSAQINITCHCNRLSVNPSYEHVMNEMADEDPFFGDSSLTSLRKRHPNLAIDVITDSRLQCSLSPDLVQIDWVNVHWQRFYTKLDGQLLLYSAFYDNRTRTEPSGGVVRVLALYRGATAIMTKSELPWCHLWYEGVMEPVPSPVIRAEYVDHQDPSKERLQLFVLTCRAHGSNIPSKIKKKDERTNETLENSIPKAVSIVHEPCDAADNLLRVIGKPNNEIPRFLLEQNDYENRQSPVWNVAVCGPALFYTQEDYSIRLIEWLELMRALEVPQVFLYYTGNLHPNIEKTLRYYEKNEFVTLTDFRYPPPYIDEPLLRRIWTKTQRESMFAMENIYFTDCLLRNMNSYRFMMHVDPDEVPVLLQHETLPELIADLSLTTSEWINPAQSFHLKWQDFPPDNNIKNEANRTRKSTDPRYLHVLRHNRRFVEDDRSRRHVVKSIYDTRDATGVTSHTIIVCAAGPCFIPYKVKLDYAYVGHFRSECNKNCSEPTVKVPQVLNHKDKVVERVKQVLEILHIFP